MKKEKMLKLMLVIVMLFALLGMATNVFAEDTNIFDDVTDENLIDFGGDSNTNTNTNTDTGTNTNTDIINTNTDTNNNYNTNLPKAGLEDNSMIGIGITVLAIASVFAYRKIKYYKDI